MTIKVTCITASLQLSPKKEDQVVQYRFTQSMAPLGKAGDLAIEGSIAVYLSAPNQTYVVGEEYELHWSIYSGVKE